jgi:hypothetical protein
MFAKVYGVFHTFCMVNFQTKLYEILVSQKNNVSRIFLQRWIISQPFKREQNDI